LSIRFPSLAFGVVAGLASASGLLAAERPASVSRVLKTYCSSCHEGAEAESEVDFTAHTTADDPREVAFWERVWDAVDANVMPPRTETQLTPDDRATLLNWIEKDVFKVDCTNPDPGRVTIRRLNRREYDNSIQDLFGVRFSAAEDFPPDDSGYGFDNIGDVLTLSPVLMDKYFNAAESVVYKTIAFDGPQEARRTFRSSEFSNAEPDRSRPRIPELRFRIDEEADYAFELGISTNTFYPFQGQVTYRLELDGELIATGSRAYTDMQPDQHRIERRFTPGRHTLRLTPDISGATQDERSTGLSLSVENVSLTGPLGRKTYPKSHERLFFKGEPPADAVARRDYAREILKRIATRAFRRPVDEPTLDRLTTLAMDTAALPGKSFEAGVAHAIQAILVSPRFLFRAESQPRPDDPDEVHPIDEFALASRLSYFLWSSIPDEQLLAQASAGTLRTNLRSEVARMLADDRADRFIGDFVGQWLQTRDVEAIQIESRRRFAALTLEVRRSLREETEHLVSHIFRTDRDVMEVLTADYTFLNGALAKFYGISDVTGSDFQKVSLPADSHRGGVLTHGSFLTVTSNPTRTSPVKRGLFVLQNILGTPPPPPPPNVPALEEPQRGSERRVSLRTQLELHRSKAECAGCHNRMDPIGLGLENFNAIGLWREEDGNEKINAEGQLVTGETFQGVDELRKILGTRREAFYRCLAGKLLTYALGRGLDHGDRCAVDRITRDLLANDGKSMTLIMGVIDSVPFQMRRGDGDRRPPMPARVSTSPTPASD
jgi:PAS domain-containing protein